MQITVRPYYLNILVHPLWGQAMVRMSSSRSFFGLIRAKSASCFGSDRSRPGIPPKQIFRNTRATSYKKQMQIPILKNLDLFIAVFRIRNAFLQIRNQGSVFLNYGSYYGSGRPQNYGSRSTWDIFVAI